MPAIIGGIWINQINSGGNAIFGDAPLIAPKSATKNFSGSGGGSTGIWNINNNLYSSTNTLDPDVNDENVIAPGPGTFTPLLPPVAGVPLPTGSAAGVPARAAVATGRNANRLRGAGAVPARRNKGKRTRRPAR